MPLKLRGMHVRLSFAVQRQVVINLTRTGSEDHWCLGVLFHVLASDDQAALPASDAVIVFDASTCLEC